MQKCHLKSRHQPISTPSDLKPHPNSLLKGNNLKSDIALLRSQKFPELEERVDAKASVEWVHEEVAKLEAMVVASEGVLNDEVEGLRRNTKGFLDTLRDGLRGVNQSLNEKLDNEDTKLEKHIDQVMASFATTIASKIDLQDLEQKLVQHHDLAEDKVAAMEAELSKLHEKLKTKANHEALKKLGDELRKQEPGRQVAMFGKSPITDTLGRTPVHGTCLVCDRPVSINPDLEHVDNHDFQPLPSPNRSSSRLGSPTWSEGNRSGRAGTSSRPRGMGSMTPPLGTNSLPASPPNSARQQRYFGGSPRLYHKGASESLVPEKARAASQGGGAGSIGTGSPKERAMTEPDFALTPPRDKATTGGR